MIGDFIVWILATFVLNPLQAELGEKLGSVQSSAAIAQQVQTCLSTGTAALANRAASEPWWAISTAFSVSVGLSDARSLLSETSPECAAAAGLLQN